MRKIKKEKQKVMEISRERRMIFMSQPSALKQFGQEALADKMQDKGASKLDEDEKALKEQHALLCKEVDDALQVEDINEDVKKALEYKVKLSYQKAITHDEAIDEGGEIQRKE